MNNTVFNISPTIRLKAGGGYFKRMAKILIKDFAFRAVFSYRLNNYKVVKSLFNFLWRPPKTIEISAISKNIGGGLWISHNYCVLSVFSAGVNLRVGPGVTVGMKNKRGESVINPIIGDNVWICTNATILGGIKIGENSIIGAGAVVTKDVPANSIVVGNPAYLLYKEKAKD